MLLTYAGVAVGRVPRLRMNRATIALVGAAILIAILIVFWQMRKRHVEDEVVEVLATGDTGPIPKLSEPNDGKTGSVT